MKNLNLIIIIFLLFSACKSDKKETISKKEITLSPVEKIAHAYGIDHWNKVKEIAFTFNVDRDSTHFERSWIWNPKANLVTLISNNDTIQYNRIQLDSTNINSDKAFINDKYWLLAPFNLLWDEGTTISNPTEEMSPISKKILNKITLTYSNEGGYTPGDAYDFYYNTDYIIEEWVYRKENAKVPTMITTWENNKNFNDITISLNHKKADDYWELYFTNISIKLE
ncbi:hypothetical protein [Xanthomarina sp. F2636L]|uniref:hypothetical protein n=1 Tax=Xanthomarina sp. F2636L TaxID=2996018 RepID=UPI00225E013B|nr:hypothetical protein [Xanthomarina sp. F2636L]MCX7550770.1 hypothetical protein [Xanthomarina sp. F2636L]